MAFILSLTQLTGIYHLRFQKLIGRNVIVGNRVFDKIESTEYPAFCKLQLVCFSSPVLGFILSALEKLQGMKIRKWKQIRR